MTYKEMLELPSGTKVRVEGSEHIWKLLPLEPNHRTRLCDQITAGFGRNTRLWVKAKELTLAEDTHDQD